MSTIRVHTTQNVTLEYEVASIGERIVAAFIDNAILLAWGIAWGAFFSYVGSSGGGSQHKTDWGSVEGIIAIIIMVLLVSPYVFYHLACEVFFNGQSLGKKARHIKVMRLDGTAPRVGDYLMRWLLRLVDTGPIGLGGLVAIITIAANGRGQRLGDLAAGTTVVSTRQRPQQATPLPANLGNMAGYQVVFPQAALLAAHDAATIRELVYQASARENYMLLNEVANKVKALTGIHTDLQDVPFLHTVLRDHAYLSANQ